MAGALMATQPAENVEELVQWLCDQMGWTDRDAAELEFYDMHGYPTTAEGA